ncbi:hypothetical protein CPB84DRAFT_1785217 [Gymnopilus junonius]|uniref:Uncharacterized protein n=1 Tax=Gymnopilus junonius TaxID=109634 RepID=A0A9P5TLM3_GYMJU|nr:hypothetical protein CPB84DRAFT_1785217 [Gymnopilus junonius]
MTPRTVENEKRIHVHAVVSLHESVEQVLNKLGIAGRFVFPGGNNVIGDPDFSWVDLGHQHPHPKLVVEYKRGGWQIC